MSAAAELRPAGDRAVLIEVGDNERALALATTLAAALGDAVEDVVPGHRTLLVTWPAGAPDPSAELRLALECPASATPPAPGGTVELSVRYDGPDLDAVAARAGLTPAEVAAAHSAPTYRVGFVGYAPGFGYLLGGDPRLQAPRHAEPRPRVAAGSVALAGPYSAVYPRDAPGGWQLIGRTEVALFDPDRQPPSLLAPGTRVRFRAEAAP